MRSFHEDQIEFSKNEIKSHYAEIDRLTYTRFKGREKDKAEMIALRQEWITEARSLIEHHRNHIDNLEK